MSPAMKIFIRVIVLTGCLALSAPRAWAGDAGYQSYNEHARAADGYLKQGKISSAIEEYRQALAIQPRAAAAWFNLAIAYHAQGNLEGAAAALEEAVKMNPRDAEAHYDLACLRLLQKKIGEAKEHFESAEKNGSSCPKFGALSKQGLGLIQELETMNGSARDLLLLLLQF